MIGKVIYHKKYGTGIIVNINRTIATISFESLNENKDFDLSDLSIALTGVLTTEDKELRLFIEKKQNENTTCKICNKIKNTIKVRKDGQRICNDCFLIVEECRNCGKFVVKGSESYQKTELCEDCFNKDYFTCNICQETYEAEDDEYLGKTVPKHERWCRYCVDACRHCKNIFNINQLHSIPTCGINAFNKYGYSFSLCDSCYDKRMGKCIKCGKNTYLFDLRKRTCDECNELDELKKQLEITNILEIPYVECVFGAMQDVQTRDLMSRLNHSSKERHIDMLLISNYYTNGKWIIVSSNSNWYNSYMHYEKCKEEFTMTEFKRKKGWSFVNELKKLDEDCLIKAKQKNGTILIWKKFILLKAQTYDDMDFRKEWKGGDLLYEGNNWGDTSQFYIIGSFYEEMG